MPATNRQVESCCARQTSRLPTFSLTKNNIKRPETLVPFRGFCASWAIAKIRDWQWVAFREKIAKKKERLPRASNEIEANFSPASFRTTRKIDARWIDARFTTLHLDWRRRVWISCGPFRSLIQETTRVRKPRCSIVNQVSAARGDKCCRQNDVRHVDRWWIVVQLLISLVLELQLLLNQTGLSWSMLTGVNEPREAANLNV